MTLALTAGLLALIAWAGRNDKPIPCSLEKDPK